MITSLKALRDKRDHLTASLYHIDDPSSRFSKRAFP